MFLGMLLGIVGLNFVPAIVHVMTARSLFSFKAYSVRSSSAQAFNEERVAKLGGIGEVELYHLWFCLFVHPQ